MCDELVKSLRDKAEFLDRTSYGRNVHNPFAVTMKQAADAIEGLNSQLDDFKRLCLPLKENRLYKYSDGGFVEVFLILPSEPPKEE